MLNEAHDTVGRKPNNVDDGRALDPIAVFVGYQYVAVAYTFDELDKVLLEARTGSSSASLKSFV